MLYLIDFLQAKKASNSLVKIRFVMNFPCAPQKSMTIHLTTEDVAYGPLSISPHRF